MPSSRDNIATKFQNFFSSSSQISTATSRLNSSDHNIHETSRLIETLNIHDNNTEDSEKIDHLALPSIIPLDKYRNLWSLSLYGCTNIHSSNLSSLSKFSVLGSLDLSATNITFITLQICLRPVNILRLFLINCPFINNHHMATSRNNIYSESNVTLSGPNFSSGLSTGYMDEVRGFLTFVLPNTWCLNGLPILLEERKHWGLLYKTGGKLQWSDLIRRHFVAFDQRWSTSGSGQATETQESEKILGTKAKEVDGIYFYVILIFYSGFKWNTEKCAHAY